MEKFIEINKVVPATPDDYILKRMRQRAEESHESGTRDLDLMSERRRWEAEFPEYHQCQVDSKQEVYWGFQYDTMHEDLGEMEYKQFAKKGVKLSPYTQDRIKDGTVKYIVVWKWADGNRWTPLEANKQANYEICGYVEANRALELLQNVDGDMRFPYPPPPSLEEVAEVEEEDRTETIRKLERMPVDKARTTALRLMEDWNPTKIGGKASKNRTIYDIEHAFTSRDICGIMYRLQLASEGLGTIDSSWQQHYRNI